MSLQITLTDEQIRVSEEFIDFILNFSKQGTNKSNWFDQISENLKQNTGGAKVTLEKAAGRPITDPVVKQAIGTSYNLTISLLIGVTDILQQIHQRYKFLVVIGCPRSGGSYLAKQFFIALGMDPSRVPGLIAHDGFPKAFPFSIADSKNEHTTMTRYMAEFLTMVDMFYAKKTKREGRIVVPKKDINTAYHGAFFATMFGESSEYFVTIRHPVTCCISSYEKSGGYPEDGKFIVRSNIETFIKRDVEFTNNKITVLGSDYFDIYLRYWEQYYSNLVLTGLTGKTDVRVVPYSAESMMGVAKDHYDRYGLDKPIEEFRVFNKRDKHPEWMEKAEQAIHRLDALWKQSGLVLPVEELLQAW